MAGHRGGRSLLVGVAALGLAGCAGVPAGGAFQTVEIELVGVPVGGPATCILSNGEAEWTAPAPGRTTVTTGAGALRVNCRAEDGHAGGQAVVEAQVRGGRGSRTWVGAGVGVLAGGAIGAATYQNDSGAMCCGRGLPTAVGALVGGLIGAAVGAAGAKPAWEYPSRVQVPMQADAAPR